MSRYGWCALVATDRNPGDNSSSILAQPAGKTAPKSRFDEFVVQSNGRRLPKQRNATGKSKCLKAWAVVRCFDANASRLAIACDVRLFYSRHAFAHQQSNGAAIAARATSSNTAHVEQHEQWGLLEVSLPGPTSGNPFVDVQLTATFQQGDDKHEVSGFYDGDGIYRVRFMPDKAGRWQYTTHSNVARARRQDGPVRRGRAAEEQPRAGARPQHISLRLRRRHALQAARHDLLRLDVAGRRARRADAQNAGGLAVQQASHVRVPEAVYVEQERAAALSVRGHAAESMGFHAVQSGVLSAFGTAHRAAARPRHRGRHHPASSVRRRALGLRSHAGRGRRPLSAVRRQPARRVSQRVVVAGQRIRFHDGEAGIRLGPDDPGRPRRPIRTVI